MSLRVAAFTQGPDVPSARFRIRQLIGPLARHGVDVTEFASRFGSYPPTGMLARLAWLPATTVERCRALNAARGVDIAIFQREMISTLALPELLWRKPAVIDVDDAIWLHQRFASVDRLARRTGNVICGNEYIARHFAPLARTWVVPTAVDTERFTPLCNRTSGACLVWSGTSSGLKYLQALQPALRSVLLEFPSARLRVICDSPPQLTELRQTQVEFVSWSPSIEVAGLQSASIGLMPMPDTPWTQGKCSFKMLTYMACGLPVIVSPVGMNATLLAQADIGVGARTLDDWRGAMLDLLRDPMAAAAAGQAGRQLVESTYSVQLIAQRVADILQQIADE